MRKSIFPMLIFMITYFVYAVVIQGLLGFSFQLSDEFIHRVVVSLIITFVVVELMKLRAK